jgi:HD-GYP domain-containing protein (c-di-GMP phosphodiesterase class II)
MQWIAEALNARSSEILKRVAAIVSERTVAAVPEDELVKQAELTLELLIEAISCRQSTALFESWETIGRTCSERDLAMSDIPRTTDVLKRAVWDVMESMIDAGEVKLGDVVDGMMVVESVLEDCWFAMVQSYLGSRDIRVASRTERMDALYRLTEVLSSESDVFEMYRAIVDKTSRITEHPRCSLLLFDDEGLLQPMASNQADLLEKLLAARADDLASLKAVFSLGGPVVLKSGDNPTEIESFMAGYGTSALLLVPLHSAENDIGVMLLDGKDSEDLTREQMDLAVACANQAVIAIEKSTLMAEMETRLKHMAAIGVVARSLTSYLDPSEQTQGLLEMACALVRASSGLILTRDDSSGDLELEAATGDISWARGKRFMRVAVWTTENSEPLLWEKGARDARFMDLDLDIEAAIVAPMLVRDKAVGVLAVGTRRPGESYSRDEVEMFKNFAAQAAVSIENVRLYQRLQETYLGTIGSLAAAIEARDPYTVGHSARVTQYAVAIAESMMLDTERVEEIRLAGLLHDLGKIGVPDHILNKTGRLNEEEYTAIKMHPALSMRIIEPLPHLENLKPIIYHHHERFDGQGYIEGKSGEDIPLGARIIAVADAYEAMTSDRPYRTALSPEEARLELRRNSGSQFDPTVVEHFLTLLEKQAS